jgi:hypothetical protein
VRHKDHKAQVAQPVAKRRVPVPKAWSQFCVSSLLEY